MIVIYIGGHHTGAVAANATAQGSLPGLHQCSERFTHSGCGRLRVLGPRGEPPRWLARVIGTGHCATLGRREGGQIGLCER